MSVIVCGQGIGQYALLVFAVLLQMWCIGLWPLPPQVVEAWRIGYLFGIQPKRHLERAILDEQEIEEQATAAEERLLGKARSGVGRHW